MDLSVRTNSLWSPNRRFANVGLEVDIEGGRPEGSRLSVDVFSDERARSWFFGDALLFRGKLLLRKTRSGRGDGRVYLVVVTLTESDGTETSEAITVTVPKSRSEADLDDVAEQAEDAKAHFDDNDGDIPDGFRRVSRSCRL